MKADLHMHTTSSDGRLTNVELINRVKSRGLDVFAITDHDIIAKTEENIELAKSLGLKYIVGIELSAIYKEKSVHILGYFNHENYKSQEIIDYYLDMTKKRDVRAKKYIKNIKDHFGLEIDYEEVFNSASGVIARPHISRAIEKAYPQYSHNYIFDNFLGNDSPAYVASTKLSVKDGLALLKRNGAFTSLAHPTLMAREHLLDIIGFGFDGIEAVYPLNKPGETEFFRELAVKHNLVITAGSDYHGINKDTRHGDVGEKFLDGEETENLLNKIF
ncbi:MAG: PHP domain-containing protein [Candidatus Izemoplasma sp.]